MSHPRYNDLDHSLANHGSFGAAELVARGTDGKYFVKNVVHLCEMLQPLSRDDLYQFGSIVKVKHPNLARVREALIVGSSKTDKEDKMVIISDFIDGGMNLQNSIEIKRQRKEKFNNDEVMRIFVQVLLGLKSLHDVGLVHGNLKPSNIFLEGLDTDRGNQTAVERYPGLDKSTIVKLVGYSLFSFFIAARKTIHLPYYAAPEICIDVGDPDALHDRSRRKHKLSSLSDACDVWSLGCIVHELLTLEKPFYNSEFQGLCDDIILSEFLSNSMLHQSGLPANFLELIGSMLQKDPSLRPSVDDILALPFLQEHLNLLMGKQPARNLDVKSDGAQVLSRDSGHGPFSHDGYKAKYATAYSSPPQSSLMAKPDATPTDYASAVDKNGDTPNGRVDIGISEDEIKRIIRTNSPSLNTLGVTDESIRLALQKEKVAAFQPNKMAVKRSPKNKSSESPIKIKKQNVTTYRTNNAMKVRKNFNQTVKMRKTAWSVSTQNTGRDAVKSGNISPKKSRSPLSPRTLAAAAASSKRRSNARKISDDRYNDKFGGQRDTFSPRSQSNKGETNSKAKQMLLRKSNEKLEKEREYEAMLAETRKQAFQERKQLERKMRGFHNPVNEQVSSDGVAAQPKRNNSFSSTSSRATSTDAIAKNSKSNRLQRRKSLDSVNRKFNSKRSMQEEEDAYKEALAKARIEAFEERKALERKMEGMGGRPSSTVRRLSPRNTNKDAERHRSVIPKFDRRHVERKPSAEEVKNLKKKQQMDAEVAYKQALAKARVEAFNERKVLEQKHRAAQGRPAVARHQGFAGRATNVRKSAPFALETSHDEADVSEKQADLEHRRRTKRQEKVAKQELYERQLESARIAAFEERKRLKNKYGRGGGV